MVFVQNTKQNEKTNKQPKLPELQCVIFMWLISKHLCLDETKLAPNIIDDQPLHAENNLLMCGEGAKV